MEQTNYNKNNGGFNNNNRNNYQQNTTVVTTEATPKVGIVKKVDQFTDKALDNKIVKAGVLIGAAIGTATVVKPVAKFLWNKALKPFGLWIGNTAKTILPKGKKAQQIETTEAPAQEAAQE